MENRTSPVFWNPSLRAIISSGPVRFWPWIVRACLLIPAGNFLDNGFWPLLVEMEQKILHSWDDVLGPYPRDGPEGCPKARDGHHASASG